VNKTTRATHSNKSLDARVCSLPPNRTVYPVITGNHASAKNVLYTMKNECRHYSTLWANQDGFHNVENKYLVVKQGTRSMADPNEHECQYMFTIMVVGIA
jgi:hypothetical protein